MVTYIKECGRMAKLMVMEYLLILMEVCIRVNGKMINNMEKELNFGIIIESGIKDNICEGKKPARVGLSLMIAHMKDTS